MVKDNIHRDELLFLDSSGSFLMFGSHRMIMVPMPAIENVVKDLRAVLGIEKMDIILTRLGYETGISCAMALNETFKFKTREDWLRSGIDLLKYSGLAVLKLISLEMDFEKKLFNVKSKVSSSAQAKVWAANFGKSTEPICSIISGVASGYASAVMECDVLVNEVQCEAQGYGECIFIAKTAKDWGVDAEKMRKYYKVSPLKDQIEKLFNALNRSQKNLAKRTSELKRLKGEIDTVKKQNGIIFKSKIMEQALILAKKVAPANANVLILGESGTGKEMFAKYIHEKSGRNNNSFIAVNCAALPPNLIESELFGHEKGAFTGADKKKKGLFLQADKGTIFLDEIGELPLDLQVKILRAIQEKEARAIGGVKNYKINARIISATNKDLKDLVSQNRFREDLYYRLSVFPINLPPLRRRKEDLFLLVNHFIEKYHPDHAGISSKALNVLKAHSWPGNVRELENSVEYALVTAGDSLIEPENLPDEICKNEFSSVESILKDLPDLETLEKRYIKTVLEKTGNNKQKASKILGISTTTLWRRLK